MHACHQAARLARPGRDLGLWEEREATWREEHSGAVEGKESGSRAGPPWVPSLRIRSGPKLSLGGLCSQILSDPSRDERGEPSDNFVDV